MKKNINHSSSYWPLGGRHRLGNMKLVLCPCSLPYNTEVSSLLRTFIMIGEVNKTHLPILVQVYMSGHTIISDLTKYRRFISMADQNNRSNFIFHSTSFWSTLYLNKTVWAQQVHLYLRDKASAPFFVAMSIVISRSLPAHARLPGHSGAGGWGWRLIWPTIVWALQIHDHLSRRKISHTHYSFL